MKKHFTLVFACLMAVHTVSASATIDMGGTNAQLDTVDSYQVGPGTFYSHLTMTKGSKVRQVYVLDVDLTNPDVTLETIIANDKIKSYETLGAMYTRKDAEGHRLVGGVNVNFWCVSATIDASPSEYEGQSGIPLQGCVSNGMIGTDVTNWDRVDYNTPNDSWDIGHLALTADKRAVVCDMRPNNWLKIGEKQLNIRDVNRPRTFTNEDRFSLYNKFIGTTPSLGGREVVFSVSGEWRINQDMVCTVTNINTAGGTRLTENQGAIQGFKGAAAELEKLQVGEQFILHTGIKERAEGTEYDIRQMVAGNAFVLHADTLTDRNFNEQYNNQDYPRPVIGTNADGTRVWIMECAKPGLYTSEACYILKSFGATEAGAYDGGGSAQMNLFGQNMFATTESTPRSLPLGLWVVSTAPDQVDASRMQFLEPLADIPAYATYTPTIRAWGATGYLMSSDFKGYKLSCEPSTLGTVSADGLSFTAASTSGEGYLIATSGSAVVKTPIKVVGCVPSFALDSVVLGNENYTVAVQANANGLILSVNPEALLWRSSDETVATVSEQGVVHGLKNGRAQIIGQVGKVIDTLNVNVQLAPAHYLNLDGGSIWQSGQQPWNNNPVKFSDVRSTTKTIKPNVSLYGCPDSIIMVVNSAVQLKSIDLKLIAAGTTNEVSVTKQFQDQFTVNTDVTITYNLNQVEGLDIIGHGAYPIVLSKIVMLFCNVSKNVNYDFAIKDLILCYNSWTHATGLEQLMVESWEQIRKIMVDGQLYIIKNGTIYDMNGNVVIR